MANSSSLVPDLGNQPPSVDFIENRMPKYSPAFQSYPVYYDTASQQFVSIERQKDVSREQISPVSIQSNAIEQEVPQIGQPIALVTSLSANTEAMKYWDDIFSDAIAQLQTTAEPKIKSPELRIRCDKGWYTIYLKLEKARSGYLTQGGQFGQMVRWCADHTAPATVLVKIAQGVAPSNPYSTPVLGAVQLILNAMQTSADARTQALDAFKDLWKVFSEAELFLSTFPTSQLVRSSAIDLTVAVLSAIENAIAFFSTSRPKRMLKSMFEGSEYVKGLERALKSIEDKSNALRNQGQNTHIATSQQLLRKTYQNTDFLCNAVLGLMNDHLRYREDSLRNAMESERRHKAELAKMRKKNLHLLVENENLRSRSPSPNNLSLAQQHVGAQRAYLEEEELRCLLNINDTDVDMSFIAKRKSHLLNQELSRAEQLVHDAKFRTWMTSPESAKLLILWNQRPPKSNAGISPVSTLCASLAPMFYNHEQFICGIWFCGLHAKSGNDDTGAMLASLIDQICQQYMFDFDNLEIDEVNKTLLENRDPAELYNLLYAFIKTLPADVTLMLLIDEVYIYEREQFEDGPSIFDELVRLVEDESLSIAVKVLFTSTGRVGYLKRAFQEKDLILNVETAAHQRGMPSEKRMKRQMMQNFEV